MTSKQESSRWRPSQARARSISSSADASHEVPDDPRVRHQPTVYDAVAGRIATKSFLKAPAQGQDGTPQPSQAETPPRLRKTTTHIPILAPEEVLFRRPAAPERYAEHDIYMAHERMLPDDSVLPDSDLLKAIHSYSSRFYASLGGPDARTVHVGSRSLDEGSMDETALLAFGILLEEAGRKALGRRGDLVFTEGLELDPAAGRVTTGQRAAQAQSASDDDDDGDNENEDSVDRNRPGGGETGRSAFYTERPMATVGFQSRGTSRQRKRRRVTDLDNDGDGDDKNNEDVIDGRDRDNGND